MTLSNAGALGNAEYPFIAIAPRSTLAQSGSTWYNPLYGLNRTELFEIELFLHLIVCKYMIYV